MSFVWDAYICYTQNSIAHMRVQSRRVKNFLGPAQWKDRNPSQEFILYSEVEMISSHLIRSKTKVSQMFGQPSGDHLEKPDK